MDDDATVSGEYWALAVALAPEAAEGVANFLVEAGATGVVEEGGGAPVVLRAFFPPPANPAESHERLLRYLDDLRALGLEVGPASVEVTPVLPEPWAEAWRAYFRPVPVGRRLLVCPPWSVPDQPPLDRGGPARLVIVIEPGRAFGTGGHASTRGCLQLLERALEAGGSSGRPVGCALDVGTGSGVLAIAAACLGVTRVHALDVDPDAVAAAAANAVRNGVAERVSVDLGTPEMWTGPAADLVLANLLGAAHVALAPTLARCTAAGGRLVAGGVLVDEVPLVVAAFLREDFRVLERVDEEEWAALCLARDGGA